MDEKAKEELLKPFKEKIDLADGFIEEIREKLGADNATLVNDSLIGLRSTITEANQLHETVVVDNYTTHEKNKKLADVNNDLYIKNSAALRDKVKPVVEELDDDEALDVFAESVIPGNK